MRVQTSVAWALTISQILASAIVQRQDTSILPRLLAPITINPDQNWDGIDGQWSSFTLRVGDPAQFVRTFVSFSVYQTWVVLPKGCQGVTDQTNCPDARGSLFDMTKSTTFREKGTFDLLPLQYLGYGGNAISGFDTVGLGGLGEGGPTLNNTIVSGFAVEDYYLGILGLNPKPTNFTGFLNDSTSYMTLLRKKGMIPSVSAAYTAGAPYVYGGVGQLASLTLGGYDASRFVPNNVEMIFGPDNSKDLLVAIQSITTASNQSSPIQLLPKPIYANIDSSISGLWLPQQACLAFEKEFNLVWDNKTALYLVNTTQHAELLARNPTVKFTLAQALQGGPTFNIELPYAAFDLQAKPPYQGLQNNSLYFPLMRAANESQYVLGRTFLQEAYLSVNWDTQRFNVSQVKWDQHAPRQIVAMQSLNDGITVSAIDSGAIAGIVVGALTLIGIIASGLAYNVYRRKKLARARDRRGAKKLDDDQNSTVMSTLSQTRDSPDVPATQVFPKAELEGSAQFGRSYYASKNISVRSQPSTASSTPDYNDLASDPANGTMTNSMHSPTSPFGEGTYSTIASDSIIHEMAGDMPPVTEKDSRSLSEKEALHRREQLYNGVTPPATAASETFPRDARPLVDPENIAIVSPTTSSFSAGHGSYGTELVSPTTPSAPPYSVNDNFPPLPALPAAAMIAPPVRRAFSFENMQDEQEMQRTRTREQGNSE